MTPVVIHRVIYGSLERFIGILIEHFAGALPLWIAPVQARLIPIADRHVAYCRKVAGQLDAAGLRSEVDDSQNRMNAKIRTAQIDKIPYILVVGDREQEAGTVAVRLRTKENLGALALNRVIERMTDAVAAKATI